MRDLGPGEGIPTGWKWFCEWVGKWVFGSGVGCCGVETKKCKGVEIMAKRSGGRVWIHFRERGLLVIVGMLWGVLLAVGWV
jgi:NADH:ubiquinone oxidoreductase subunit B-like Fe-S oxidoreductase